MTADLSALIARLEAAEEVTHEFEVEFAAFMYAHPAMFDGMVNYTPDLWAERNASPLSSLDAAHALAERAGVCRLWNLWKSNSGYVASFEGDKYSRSSTPALALCIATLRAKLDGYEAEGEVNKNPKAQEG